jgi:hypothetical protein
MKSKLLWAGIALSPIIWFINLEANFALAPLACSGRGKLLAISGVSLALTMAAGIFAWAQLDRQESPDGHLLHWPPRAGDMALVGIGLSGLSFLVILAQTIPILLLTGCE